MQGQPSLTNFIQKITFDTLPRSLILSGPTGCGKKLFISELSQKLNLDLNYLSEINLDILDTIQSRAIPMLYIIPDDLLTTKNQNTLLKFIEEPNPLAFYIIVTSKLNSIIETIRNRCQILVFENYSKDILKQFLIDEDESILNFVTTPGDIIELRKIDFKFLVIVTP